MYQQISILNHERTLQIMSMLHIAHIKTKVPHREYKVYGSSIEIRGEEKRLSNT